MNLNTESIYDEDDDRYLSKLPKHKKGLKPSKNIDTIRKYLAQANALIGKYVQSYDGEVFFVTKVQFCMSEEDAPMSPLTRTFLRKYGYVIQMSGNSITRKSVGNYEVFEYLNGEVINNPPKLVEMYGSTIYYKNNKWATRRPFDNPHYHWDHFNKEEIQEAYESILSSGENTIILTKQHPYSIMEGSGWKRMCDIHEIPFTLETLTLMMDHQNYQPKIK